MDGTMLPLDFGNGLTDHFYLLLGQKFHKVLHKSKSKATSHPKSVMAAMGNSYRGQSAMYFVNPKSKVTSEFFIK